MRTLIWLTLLAACGTPTETAPTEAAPAGEHQHGDKAHEHEGGDADHDHDDKKKGKSKAPKAKVMFIEPADGATVKSPVHMVFGVEGMEVKPAGELAPKTGHHHVIIGPAGIAKGEAVPKDEQHIHFGAGQTEADIELPPGEHKLTMQFADGNHTSYGEVMATTITITVEE